MIAYPLDGSELRFWRIDRLNGNANIADRMLARR
jgi:hypothetical protein